jgi:molybdopterin molybdotransferase
MNTMLPYAEARQRVIEVVGTLRRPLARENVDLGQAFGRVLAEPVFADRDYPPFDRSTRDGFAVRSDDASAPNARLECLGEIRAGGVFEGNIGPGQCVEIMTGAAVPSGADAVVMIEHTKRAGNTVTLERAVECGQSIVPRRTACC